MKQNKKQSALALSTVFLLLYFGVAFYMGRFPLMLMMGDVGTYVKHISEEYITNWHSSMFICEGIMLKHLLSFMGCPLDGALSYLFMYYAGVVIIGVCMAHWLYKALIVHWFYVLLLPCWLVVSVLLYRYTYGSLDFFFIVVTSLYASVVLEHRKEEKIGACKLVLLIILMVHMVAFRKNSVCIMPILLWTLCSSVFLYPSKITRFIVSVVGSLIVFYVANALPTTQKTYPMFPMFSSDMKITDILLDKVLSGSNPYYTVNVEKPVLSSTIKGHFPEYSGILNKRDLNQEDYDIFMKAYGEYWHKYTKEMIFSLMAQRIQFYNRGVIPEWFVNIVEEHYPCVKNNKYAWDSIHVIKRGNYLLMWAIMLPACIYAVMNVSKLFQKISDGGSCITQACWAALVYFGSFLLVTPVPAVRYIMPSVFVLSIVSFIISVKCFYRLSHL